MIKAAMYLLVCLMFINSYTSNSQEALGLKSPIGGELFVANNFHQIIWNYNDESVKKIDIYVWDIKTSKWLPIVKNYIANKLIYNWMIPADLFGNYFRIKIVESKTERELCSSLTFFKILENNNFFRKLTYHGQAFEQEKLENFDLRVFPNPVSSSEITVKWLKQGANLIVVSDLLGRKLISVNPTSNKKEYILNLEGIKSGSYIVSIRYDDRTIYTKMLNILK